MEMDILEGVRVLDFTLAAVGPFCARVLRDLGADVIHVEWPRTRWEAALQGTEDSRFTKQSMMGEDGVEGQLFAHVNAGKKSLAINLKSEDGVAIVRKLVSGVDVVIENMTPRVMASFGLDFESLHALNPSLIMCSLTGFGQEGLEGDTGRPCTDPVAQAMSGVSWMTGERDGPPYAVGGGLGDTVTSVTGVTAILAALIGRDRVGGQHIDLSMVESLAYLDCTALPAAAMAGQSRIYRNGQQNSYLFPMGPFKANGGYIAIQAPGSGIDSPWGRLCQLMDRTDLVTDDRYLHDFDRLGHSRELIDVIEKWLCSLDDVESALALLGAERISSGPVLSQDQILVHPYFESRGTFGDVDYPELGAVKMVQPPFNFSRSAAYVRGPAPEMGEHTREILRTELGLPDGEIDRLMELDVLYESPGACRRNQTR